MFVRKLIAAMLLGIYGIPAAVGPHWHHHEHAHEQGVEACAAPPQLSRRCCHHHHGAVAKGDSHRRAPAGVADPNAQLSDSQRSDSQGSESDDQAAGICSICQFYATASWQAAAPALQAESRCVTILAAWRDSATLSPVHRWQVRGPPVLRS